MRASGEQGGACAKAGFAIMVASIGCRKFAGEEGAQHVGDGLAALEGRDLDAGAQLWRHIDGEPRGEEVAGGWAPGSKARVH